MIELIYDSRSIGYGLFCDGLYKLSSTSFGEVLCVMNMLKKMSLIRESYFMLWHKWLGHISNDRMERLVKVEILPSSTYLILTLVWIV